MRPVGTTILGLIVESISHRTGLSSEAKENFPYAPMPDHQTFVVREIVRNAYKVKWKLAPCRAFAELSLGADVNSSNFQEALRPVSVSGHVQDPRSIFGSDHQRLI